MKCSEFQLIFFACVKSHTFGGGGGGGGGGVFVRDVTMSLNDIVGTMNTTLLAKTTQLINWEHNLFCSYNFLAMLIL